MAGQRCRERGGNGRGRGGRGDRGGRGPRLTRGLAALSRAAVIIPLALLAAACGDSGTEGLTGLPPLHAAGGGTTDSTAQRAHDPALVGTWSRTLVVSDSTGTGVSQLAETRWTFAADGSVIRRSVTAEFVFGFSDELVEQGTWFTSGTSGSGTVTIRLEGDVTQGTTFDYAVTTGTFGRQLVLGSLVYQSLEQ